MLRRLAVIVLVLDAATMPALGVEILDSVLQVSFEHNGKAYAFEDHTVPRLPGNACYSWYIRAAEVGAPVNVVERFVLPVGLDWGPSVTEPDSPTKVEQDGKIATTTLALTTDSDGVFSHGWCVAEGDPLGQHSMEVSADGVAVAAFHFEVVDPAAYTFPAAPVTPADRSAFNTW